MRAYSMKFKMEVIKYAEQNSHRSAGTKFQVDVKRVKEWRKQSDEISVSNAKKQRLAGGGRK